MDDRGILAGASDSASQPAEVNALLSSEEVLRRLVTWAPSPAERRRLIIDAEVLDFEPHQLERLDVALSGFISNYRYRESNDPADLVAVGAAIRKYVATMGVDEGLPYVARLLEAGPETPVPPEIELESTKMVVRKLTANPPKGDDAFPDLADRLLEITRTYLNPRLLTREKYGAITLNAILGLLLLRSRHAAEVLRLLSELGVPWFKQSLACRAKRIEHELKERHPGESLEWLVGPLNELESLLV
jgi:hypothetical protein